MQAETLDQIFKRIFSLNVSERYDPWFKDYCFPLVDPIKANRLYNYRKYFINLANIKPDGDSVALDAGCGFGPSCICFNLLGFGKVIGLDIYDPMIQTMKQYLPGIGLENKIFPMTGDVDKLSSYFPPNTFDLILSNEAISHYHDVDGFLNESLTVLKPGGVLIISDNNNGANPKIRKMNLKIWDAFENGPPQQIFIHTVKEPYIEKRRRIIRDAYPSLDANKIDLLAKGTFCMNKQQILDAVQRYLSDEVLPQSFYSQDICPLDPDSNTVMESIFDPSELVKKMRGIGFEAKALSYLGGATRGGIVYKINRIWQAFSFITLRYSHAFIIIARKIDKG